MSGKRATPAIPLFGDAYLADTRHLSLEEHGAYLQLLMIAWRIDGCCLPDDDARLARMLGITGARWRKLKPTVMAFWELEDGVWKQARLSKERQFVEEKSAKNKASADARWEAKSLENIEGDKCERISERNAPPPPEVSKEDSVANATDADGVDPLKILFQMGRQILMDAGKTKEQAGSLIGMYRKDNSDGEVMAALIECRTKAISNPVEWLAKRLGGSQYVSASGFKYRGGPEAVMRDAERRGDWNTYWKAKADLECAPADPAPRRKPTAARAPPGQPIGAQVQQLMSGVTNQLRATG